MWHSEKTEIQFWKGVSLLGLTCNHLFLWPLNALSQGLAITYQPLGWFTFASIYFASAGILWGRKAEVTSSYWQWNLKRAGKLLLWVFIATLIFKWGGESKYLAPAPWQTHLNWNGDLVLLSATLGQKLPWLLDVIWLHAWLGVFTAILWRTPALTGNPIKIVIVSSLIWIADQLDLFDQFVRAGASPPWHSWTSWQLLFVLGATLQKKEWKNLLNAFSGKKLNRALLAGAVILFAAKTATNRDTINKLIDTQKFGSLFALNSLVLLSLLKVDRKISLFNCFTNAGRYSLSGYSLQCLLVYGLGSNPIPGQSQPINALIILVISILILVVFSNCQTLWRRK
jgi:hypothetical protein